MLIGSGVFAATGGIAVGGATKTEVGCICGCCKGSDVTVGRDVGACALSVPIGVRVGCTVFVGTSVKSSVCCGELVKVHAPSKNDMIMMTSGRASVW